MVTGDRVSFTRLIYRRDGVEETGTRALARTLEHGPAPMAMMAWAIRFPYWGGAVQRLSLLAILAWRRRMARLPSARGNRPFSSTV